MRRTLLVILLLMSAWAQTGARGSTFIVATNGDDRADGSALRPWRTIARALAQLKPGDKLFIHGGEYRETVRGVVLRPGTERERIEVTAYPGERPAVRGLLWLNRPSFWTFDGLNVTWDDQRGQPRDHMVKITDGVGWVFKNAEVSHSRSFAALLVYSSVRDEPRDWTISGCEIHDTHRTNGINQDHLIYVNSGGHANRGVIERNLLYNATNGEGVKVGAPRPETPSPSSITIQFNTIFNTSQSILLAYSTSHVVLRRNLFARTAGANAAIRCYKSTGTGNILVQNWIFTTGRWLRSDPGYGTVDVLRDNVTGSDPEIALSSREKLRPSNQAASRFGRYADATK